MNSIKAKLKVELDKLKIMNFTEKRQYIWEYYKIPILATLFLVIMFGSLINSWFINPAKKEYLHVAWMSEYEFDDSLNGLTDRLTEALVDDVEKEKVYLSTFYGSNDPQYEMAVYNRFVAMVSASQLDIVIANAEDFQLRAPYGYYMDIRLMLTKLAEVDPALAETLNGRLYYETLDETGERIPFAFSLEGCPLFESLNINTEGQYFCVLANTNRESVVLCAIQTLYE